jgi:polysaccharide export outer membrane protein
LGKPALGGERRPLYRLRKSDVVEVAFTFSPEFDQSVSVLPDGYIQLKGRGNVYAEGETLPELQTAIQKAYGGILHDPEVTVTLKEFDKPYFTASGEVSRPGKYELRSDTNVIEAVAIAGGFTQQARHSEVVLFHRASGDRMETRVVNVKKMLNSRKFDEEVRLRPGDMLFVPQSTVSKVRKYVPIPTLGFYVNGSQFYER